MSTEKTYLCDEYKLYFKIEDDVQILHNEVELYNTSFVGNNSFCHEEYIDGQRALTYSIPAMITMNQFITKKIHRDELVDIMFSIADQLMYLKANDMPLGKSLPPNTSPMLFNPFVVNLRHRYMDICLALATS